MATTRSNIRFSTDSASTSSAQDSISWRRRGSGGTGTEASLPSRAAPREAGFARRSQQGRAQRLEARRAVDLRSVEVGEVEDVDGAFAIGGDVGGVDRGL